MQYFLPNHLTLFELAILAHVVHKEFPTYLLLGEDCYFYAALVYQAAKIYFGARPVANPDKTQDDLIYHINKHLPIRYGRWNGLMVKRVNPRAVSNVVAKYK